MTPRAIEHITLTTGAARMSPCSEVDDRVLARVRSPCHADVLLEIANRPICEAAE